MDGMLVFFVTTVVVFGFSILGGWLAREKNRDATEGYALGFLFGPFGVLIEALLPTFTTEQAAQRATEQAARRTAKSEKCVAQNQYFR